MVYSSSYVWSEYKYADQFFYLKRQLLFCGVGVIGMFFFMAIPYSTWKKHSKIILLACFLLLLAVLVPGIGMERGGAQSWIGVGAFSIQPSEFMKLGLIIFLAVYLSAQQKYITSLKKGRSEERRVGKECREESEPGLCNQDAPSAGRTVALA